MASFVGSLINLLVRRRPREGRLDEETAASSSANAGSATLSSTLGGGTTVSMAPSGPRIIQINNAGPGGPGGDNDALTVFRLLLGIASPATLGFGELAAGPGGVPSRPAANVGLYSRVVHAEQTAQDSFKVFSVVINACYFLQIIVAAALTALGAAGANSKAVTAFGAINTVIAGFLTFLKGSGLPGRLKYVGDQWRAVREFMEQRERDFSGPDCDLDVHEEVLRIEEMYARTKHEIEMNTPDSFNPVTKASVANLGAVPPLVGSSYGGLNRIGGVVPTANASITPNNNNNNNTSNNPFDMGGGSMGGMSGGGDISSKIGNVITKVRSLEAPARSLKSRVERKAHEFDETLHHAFDDEKQVEAGFARSAEKAEKAAAGAVANTVANTVNTAVTTTVTAVEEERPRVARTVSDAAQEVREAAATVPRVVTRDVTRDVLSRAYDDAGREVGELHARAWDDARASVARQVRLTADGLDAVAREHDRQQAPPRRDWEA